MKGDNWTPLGKMRTPLELQEDVGGERDSRGHASLWQKRCDMNGFVRQLSAQDALVFNQLYPSATHEVRTHYLASVAPNPAMRLAVKGTTRILELVGIENIEERNIEWRFLCSEKVAVRDGET